MNKLTCVITFLNEHIEVFRTVKSIRDTAGTDVDIVLVNDGSNDGISYQLVAREFNCKYIHNTERQGVANSRDIGVAMSETEYCMILDSHMRFYDKVWYKRIIEELDNNPRKVYCTACKTLWWPLDDEYDKEHINKGAYLATSFYNHYDALEPKWAPLKDRADGTEDVPVVLGANYGFSKEFYEEIRGLHGLKMYGSDEVWLSLKAWAIGDGCAVLNDITIGHVFREKHPYYAPMAEAMWNRAFIVSVVYPDKKDWLQWIFENGGKPTMEIYKNNIKFIIKTAKWFRLNQRIGWRQEFNELNRSFYRKK